MATMIARIKVKDYDAWRQMFDAGAARRQTAGLFNERVYRFAEDGSELMLVMEASDLNKAKEFAASADRQAAMDKSGVVGPPTDYFVE